MERFGPRLHDGKEQTLTQGYKAPTSEVFDLKKLPTVPRRATSYVHNLYQELKQLSAKEQGKLVNFQSSHTGLSALRRIAEFADADGFDAYNQLVPGSSNRYMWLRKKGTEALP
jgi:hypothetical protein